MTDPIDSPAPRTEATIDWPKSWTPDDISWVKRQIIAAQPLDVGYLVGALHRVARELPDAIEAEGISLADLDSAARAVMTLEAMLVAEVTRHERQLEKEAALARANRIAAARNGVVSGA